MLYTVTHQRLYEEETVFLFLLLSLFPDAVFNLDLLLPDVEGPPPLGGGGWTGIALLNPLAICSLCSDSAKYCCSKAAV